MKPWYCIVAVVGIPILYFLSIGPVFRYCGYSRTRTVIYGPLTWVCDHSKPLSKALIWYTDVWDPMPQNVPQGGISN